MDRRALLTTAVALTAAAATGCTEKEAGTAPGTTAPTRGPSAPATPSATRTAAAGADGPPSPADSTGS